jgi:hypothetical protein
MAKKPDDRFSGMDEVTEALEPYLAPGSTAASVETPPAAGSAHRLAGLPRAGGSSIRPGAALGGSRSGQSMPPQTPTPGQPRPAPGRSNVGQPNPFAAPMPGRAAVAAPPAPASYPQTTPAARPMPGRAAVQSRGWPAAAQADEVPLTPAGEPAGNPHAARMSASWTTGALPERKKPAFGLIGFLAAALTVVVLVFLAVKVLMPDVLNFNFGQ